MAVGDQSSRCRAHSRFGERCGRHPIPGGTVCTMHGGAAPQVARRARRRLLDASARRALWRMGVWPTPGGDVLKLAAALDELRATAPKWWVGADEQTRYRHGDKRL